VGDGPGRESIEKAVLDLGLRDRVALPGMRDDVQEWLHCMDVFCLSSSQEGTSITLLEAGACGVPAVVTDVGGNGEIVRDGVTGVLVSSGDERGLAAAFARLAADRRLREHLGDEARRRVKARYSVDRMVEQYLEVYRQAVGAEHDG
jgi:glycosyltransferase involved in cell wall biosynthesis